MYECKEINYFWELKEMWISQEPRIQLPIYWFMIYAIFEFQANEIFLTLYCNELSHSYLIIGKCYI